MCVAPDPVLSPAIASILPQGVVAAEIPRYGDAPMPLGRGLEFASGRACANRALMELTGEPNMVVGVNEDRSPLWPAGFVGSITHTDRICTAVAARKAEVTALGIDAECVDTSAYDARDVFCTEAEMDLIASSSLYERERLAALLFSAKESFFKCQFGLARQWLDASQIAVTLDFSRGTFGIDVVSRLVTDLPSLRMARFIFRDDHVLTACSM
jgi:4'-phosphopantetheinyl transferase EntD